MFIRDDDRRKTHKYIWHLFGRVLASFPGPRAYFTLAQLSRREPGDEARRVYSNAYQEYRGRGRVCRYGTVITAAVKTVRNDMYSLSPL